MLPRDEYGDPIRAQDVLNEDDMTDGDHKIIKQMTTIRFGPVARDKQEDK